MATSFSTFSSFHCEGHVIFEDVEHQLKENIPHHYLHCNFL